ncbi:SEA (Seh1-associated) complex subunit [Curvularia kusanoi]|uniref:SEA (Seh1-associated) complex subunit n=1 Tax=Curvularia kusanoi TaxID=90978 RepID=A0A9P4TEY3_CURKU|nr:SEA (Seh1-associated) complex subunit [Curvularia kusanoi]
MTDHRRISATASPSIPPPPPPPPPKIKSRSYFERFVAQPLQSAAYASRPPSVQAHRADGAPLNPLVPKLLGIRTGRSLEATHKTGLDISALDINRERTHAVLAGKEILKTVRVDGTKIVDETNLRAAAALSYGDSHARQREGLGIQDVKWSHGQFSSHIATAVANGKVILYDLNRANVELVRLHEHTRQVHKLAFNPHQGHLLLSASHDATVRLWDLRDLRSRGAATCSSRDQFSGMSGGIRDVQWSPMDAMEFAFGTDNGTIQRWDFRQNKSPKQKIPAHDQKTFGKEGIFQQNDVHHAPKTTDRRPLQAIALSPNGELGGVTQKRSRPRRPTDLSYDNMYLGAPPEKQGSLEKSSLRSSAENSLDDSFLSTSMKRHHGRTASNRSAKSFSSTPPSDVTPKVMFLPDAMSTQGEQFQPNQLAFRGVLPGATNVQVFAYLAQKYKAQSLPDRPVLDSYLDLEQPFQQNAEYAQRAAYHRLAQTWTLVGAAMANATKKRAEMNRRTRLKDKKAKFEDPNNTAGQLHVASKPWSVPKNPAVRAIYGNIDRSHPTSPLAKPATPVESTSNLATPLARALNTSVVSSDGSRQTELPDPDHDEKIKLPPSVMGVPKASNGSQTSASTQPNSHGAHWYDSPEGLEERRAAAGSWRASPRIPLNLNPAPVRNNNPNVPPPLERHDSGESFTMFSASTDSHHGSSVSGSFESVGSNLPGMDGLSTGWQTAPDKSSFGRSSGTDRSSQDLGLSLSPMTRADIDTHPIFAASQARNTNAASSQDETGHLLPPDSTERVTQEMDALRRTNQFMRHDSSESSAYASSHGGTSFSSTYSLDMAASGTIIPDTHDDSRSPPQAPKPSVTSPILMKAASHAALLAKDSQLLLSDFEAMQIDAESTSAFTVVGLLNSILQFHTDTLSDAQFPSLLLLLLAPLLPQTHLPSEASDVDVTEVLNAFSDTFTGLGLTPAQAKAILSKQLELLRKKADKEKAKAVKNRDDWKVRESRAVSAVRGAFGENGSQPPSPSSHQQRSQTPSGGRKGDGKAVRVFQSSSNIGPPTGANPI